MSGERDTFAAGDPSQEPRHALAVQLKHVAVRSPHPQKLSRPQSGYKL